MGITNEHWDRIRAAAKEVQPDDHEYLERELWQSIRELFENAEAGANDELGIANQLEDKKGSTVQYEKPIIQNI